MLNAMITAKALNILLPDVHAEKVQNRVINVERQTDADSPPEIPDQTLSEDMEVEVCGDSIQTAPFDDDLAAAIECYDKLILGKVSADEVSLHTSLDVLKDKVEKEKTVMMEYCTARLRLQFMDMIDTLRQFIKAERTDDWQLHIKSVQDMLPYFAAAGHNLYAKSCHIPVYLQQMMELPQEHPDVFAAFMKGYHVIRVSDRYWAGLSSDLVIEQSLMRTMKTTGGLTRGRGMSESQRALWVLSMPACSDINRAMQTFTELDFWSTEQHKDVTTARQTRDNDDLRSLLGFLQNRNPFDRDTSLHNIATGVTADSNVNADEARNVGCKILESMEGENVLEYTFKKKDKVVTMNSKVSTKVNGESISVDPQLLFQRLVTAASDVTENIADIFKYELCNTPTALFEPSGLPRKANKPAIADAIWTAAKGSDMPSPSCEDMQYVIDGGSLLHRLLWPRGSTFNAVCKMYVDYVCREFTQPVVVFDGYLAGPSTKDIAHLQRTGGVVGVQVNFDGEMTITSKKEHFLANSRNKQKFVTMLGEKLHAAGCKVVHADGDADVLIVQTSVTCASVTSTTVIGEDTDLLVLLCFHTDLTSFPTYLQSDKKQLTKKSRIWDIQYVKRSLGPEMCALLPFAHAIAGCDTTSRLFGIGKGVPLQKLKSDPHFKQQAETFIKRVPKEDIFHAGEEVLICLYGGRAGECLDDLRYRRFCEKVAAGNSSVQVHTLPPTTAAARCHIARVYYQVHEWIADRDRECLNPTEWGWIEAHGRLEPQLTDLPAAPENLLSVIRCNCKTDCSSRRCSCKKHGLDCSSACGECRGVGCSNSPVISQEFNSEDCDY